MAADPIRMTIADFLAWEPDDFLLYELVDGQPRAIAPAGTIHGFLKSELGSLIRNHLLGCRPDSKVLVNPSIVPRVMSAHNLRVPDLGVTCSPLVPGQATLSDPMLLVEILSPSNKAKAWSNVWTYSSIPSVREILILDSAKIAAEVLRRGVDGAWPDRPSTIQDGLLVLTSIDFRLPLAELYTGTGLQG